MLKLASTSAILALLLQSVLGMLPLSHVPHEHILIGNVTPEELRAHEAAEAREAGGNSNPAPLFPSSNIVVTPHGGLIVSLAPAELGLVSVLHFELAVQLATLYFFLVFCQSLANRHLHWQTLFLISPDPPPRLKYALEQISS
jgi:hypothetical protein